MELLLFTAVIAIAAATFAGYQLSIIVNDYLEQQKQIAKEEKKREIINSLNTANLELEKAIQILQTEPDLKNILLKIESSDLEKIYRNINRAGELSKSLRTAYDLNAKEKFKALNLHLVNNSK
jgi:predicted ATP-dependent protease